MVTTIMMGIRRYIFLHLTDQELDVYMHAMGTTPGEFC
jgi:hypothetical protein